MVLVGASGGRGEGACWEIGGCGGAQIDACAAARSANATKSPLGQQATGGGHKKGRGSAWMGGEAVQGGGLFEKAASICYLHVSKKDGDFPYRIGLSMGMGFFLVGFSTQPSKSRGNFLPRENFLRQVYA